MAGRLSNEKILKYLEGVARNGCRNFSPRHENKLLTYISSFNTDEAQFVTKFATDDILYRSIAPTLIAAEMIKKQITYPSPNSERELVVSVDLSTLWPNDSNDICGAYEMFYEAGYTFLEWDFGTLEYVDKSRLPFKKIKELRQLKREIAELRDESSRLRDEMACLRDEVTCLRAENLRLDAGVEHLRDDAARLRGENSQVRGEVSQVRGEVSQVRGENVRLEAENVQVRAENAHLRDENTRLAEVKQLRAEHVQN